MKIRLLMVALIVLVIVGAASYVYAGWYDIGADTAHSPAVYWLVRTVRNRSIAVRTANIRVPSLDDPKLMSVGAGQYASMCSGCHLAPGYDKDETWEGLYPRPPKLYQGTDLTPAEVFWVLKHGIKMSGMPAWGITHDDGELWAITAFVERLPKLSPQQYKDIVAAAPADTDMTMMPMPGAGAAVLEQGAAGRAMKMPTPAPQ